MLIMRRLLLIGVFLLISFTSKAQDEYVNAIGLRGGLFNGVTFKHFVTPSTAIEGMLTSRWSGYQITGLMEHHRDIRELDGFRWFYGYGAHIGFYEGHYVTWGNNNNYMVVGIDGIIGIEYLIPNIPISLSLDWKPYFNFMGYSGFAGDDGALGIRYTF